MRNKQRALWQAPGLTFELQQPSKDGLGPFVGPLKCETDRAIATSFYAFERRVLVLVEKDVVP